MDKFCEDCIHNDVCQYGAIPPHIDRCNDKDTLDDIRPQGKWIRKVDGVGFVSYICSECGAEIEVEDSSDDKFCFNCGADMRSDNDKRST